MKKRGRSSRILFYPCALAVILLVMALCHAPADAQALGWEGETGVFVTPLAYTASAEGQKLHAVVAYHFFDAGSVISEFHEASVEVGAVKRFDFSIAQVAGQIATGVDLKARHQEGVQVS
jgi:hypothetical protein